MPASQRVYQSYLEGLLLARTQQLLAADACLEQVTAELRRVEARFRIDGLSDELTKIEALVRKAQAFEKVV